MALANDLYTYRRLAKPNLKPAGLNLENQDWPTTLPGPPANIQSIEAEQIKDSVLKQAAADRVLYFNTLTPVYRVDADPAAIRLNNHGVAYLDCDLPKAFRCLRQATRIDPDFGLAWNNLGLVYLEIGELEQAAEYFHRAIHHDEGLDIAHGNAGLASLEAGDYPAAWDLINQAISLDPQEPIHYNSLGILWLELSSPREAIQCFDIAIQLNPELPMPYHNRGRACLQLEDYGQAEKDFATADRIDLNATAPPAGAAL